MKGYIHIGNTRKLLRSALIGLILAILVSGCNIQKWCWNRYPPEIRSDTVVFDTTIYRDTTLYVKIQADTVYEKVPVEVPCPELDRGDIRSDTLCQNTEYAEAEAWVSRGELHLRLIQKESLIEFKLDSVIRIKDHFEALYRTEIHKSPPEKKIRFRDKIKFILIGFGIGLLTGLVISVFLKRR